MSLLRKDPETEYCQRICDLPNDLLLRILVLIPTKDAVATSILSKRWRCVWKMLHKLSFKDDQGSESIGWLIDKSLQLHKARKILSLVVELGPPCPVDVDVIKWVDKVVNHGVQKLEFKLLWTGELTSFSKSCLYTCDTLVSLSLSDKILVDVSFPASLPSLLLLFLYNVVYKDEDSLARLLSSSPILHQLVVERRYGVKDNLTNFTVKVPSLKILYYTTKSCSVEEEEEEEKEDIGSLVIDSPALTYLWISDQWEEYCSLIENMFCLDDVIIDYGPNADEKKFLRCLSSVRRLSLYLSGSMAACCCNSTIELARLIDLEYFADRQVDWLKPLIVLLQNSPNLKILTIGTQGRFQSSWNQPRTIPQCLLSHLEIVRWIDYQGKEDEKQLLTYILANSNCLKRVEISLMETCNLEECQKELESMPRISPSSHLFIQLFKSIDNFTWGPDS